jgi:asparagine synthase (glutamine-hydrolysing)
MCGIAGFFGPVKNPKDILIKMGNSIKHRGPNDSDEWYDPNSKIGLSHRRLSIIDLTKFGRQPMISKSGRYVIVYNGEIYNHLDLRNELSNKYWNGSSDTETLLQCFEEWELDKTLIKIVGMFSFALWDGKLRCLTLCRDRMGEKPLYFGWQGTGYNSAFLFGSELKALTVHPQFRQEINRDAIALQLRHNYIPAPYSIYNDIYKLLPGHYLQLNENDFKKKFLPDSKPYWSLTDVAISGANNPLTLSIEDIINQLEKLLHTSIKQKMISDVPLGAFLSGGVDSSTVVALMQAQSAHKIKTFSIGINDDDYNEAKYAKEVAKHLGTDHTEIYVSAQQAMAVIPKLPTLYDEPFSDSSQIPTFLVSQLAKQYVTVSLSGDGGDELFCGYNRYTMSKNLWNKLSLIPFSFRKILASGIDSITPQSWNKLVKYVPSLNKYLNFGDKIHKGANLLNCRTLSELHYKLVSHCQNPNEIVLNSKEPSTFLTNYKPKLPGLDDQQQMMALDSLTYLPDDILVKIDRAAMAISLETRVPFLDHRVVEYAWRIPQSLKLRNGQSKWILRQILYKYVPKKIIERPKMGFGIPIGTWLRGPLRDWAECLLNATRLRQQGYLNPDLIRAKWSEHLSGKRNWQYHLWDVLMFQSWLDKTKNKICN